ncbi:MAG: hypothetical protein P8Y71_25525 [Pseudolabrys sp.]|jgi:hypothetical protein
MSSQITQANKLATANVPTIPKYISTTRASSLRWGRVEEPELLILIWTIAWDFLFSMEKIQQCPKLT